MADCALAQPRSRGCGLKQVYTPPKPLCLPVLSAVLPPLFVAAEGQRVVTTALHKTVLSSVPVESV